MKRGEIKLLKKMRRFLSKNNRLKVRRQKTAFQWQNMNRGGHVCVCACMCACVFEQNAVSENGCKIRAKVSCVCVIDCVND